MDDDYKPLDLARAESLFSSPLIRMTTSTAPACDTATGLIILCLSRVRNWTSITPLSTLRRDAVLVVATQIASAVIAAVEAYLVDRCLPSSSALRSLYILSTGLYRLSSNGSVQTLSYNLFGGDLIFPDSYMSFYGGRYIAELAMDMIVFLYRLIRLRFGRDLWALWVRPFTAVVYWSTFIAIIERKSIGRYLGRILLPNLDHGTQLVTLYVLLATVMWTIYTLGYFSTVIQLLTRLPDVNRRNLKRAVIHLASWDGGKMEGETFMHRPLKKAREIRLLQLMPRNGFHADTVRAELLHVSIEDAPEYDCVSYTWGDLSKTTESFILVEGRRIATSQKVHDMLAGLTKWQERLLWVDCICINQNDLDEKSTQVPLMRDIFRRAANVIAWLEPSSDVALLRRLLKDAEKEMDKACRKGYKWGKGGGNVLTETFWTRRDEKEIVNLLRFYSNPWFSRVWIIQEVAVAKKPPLIRYGKETFPWTVLMELASFEVNDASLLGIGVKAMERPRIQQGLYFAHIMNNTAFRVQQNKSIDLAVALQDCAPFQASERKDKIIALLGFTSDTSHRALNPDYNQSNQQLYTSAAQYLYSVHLTGSQWSLQTAYRLRILHMAGIGLERKTTNLASWVPDWSARHSSKYLIGTRTIEDDPYEYRASGMLEPCGGLFLNQNIETLRLQGAIVDTIKEISNPLDYECENPNSDPYSLLFGAADRIDDIREPEFESPEFQSGLKLLRWHMEAGQLCNGAVDDPYPTGESRLDAFWLMLVGNKVRDRQTNRLLPGDEKYQKFLDIGRLFLPPLEGRESMGENFRFSDIWTRYNVSFLHAARRFCVTQGGFMGLVPAGSKTGDLVCIISGAHTPFLLARETNSTYLLVGECYMHGMMDGEMVSKGLDMGWFDLV